MTKVPSGMRIGFESNDFAVARAAASGQRLAKSALRLKLRSLVNRRFV